MLPAGGDDVFVLAHMGDDVLNKLVVFALGGKIGAHLNIAALKVHHLKVSEQHSVQLAEIFDDVFLDFVRILLGADDGYAVKGFLLI